MRPPIEFLNVGVENPLITQMLQGGFPIEIETNISKLNTYSLAIFIIEKYLSYM